MNHLKPLLRVTILLILCTPFVSALGQDVRYDIRFPDLPGYKMYACDLHMHTVFSDGTVWPTVRVEEAWRQGLDVISITDHVEYHPHKDDLPINHGRPYDLAVGTAQAVDLLLIRGTEITRDTPPGHFNAIFLDDINKLDTPEFLDAIKAANAQGAFVWWNHQAWQGEDKGKWLDLYTTMYDNKLFQGMEVCNGSSYYPTAHKWCLEKNLTMLGNTDIHDPDLRKQSLPGDHRTMTLVFAKERTPAALKEALLAGRTAVWYKDQLIGRKEILEPLFDAALRIQAPIVRSGKNVYLRIANSCDTDIKLTRSGGNGPASIAIPAQATKVVEMTTAAADTPLDLQYTATNFLIAPDTGLPVVLKVPQE
jgi:3',5'-nucleoside bisphosphate phosphatase